MDHNFNFSYFLLKRFIFFISKHCKIFPLTSRTRTAACLVRTTHHHHHHYRFNHYHLYHHHYHHLLEGRLVHHVACARPATVHMLQTLIEEILEKKSVLYSFFKFYFTRIADIAATMAGVPKPWLIMEKWVKCLWEPEVESEAGNGSITWMLGSSSGCGLVLHRGLRSWFRKSTSSLQINLRSNRINQHQRWHVMTLTWRRGADPSSGRCRHAA